MLPIHHIISSVLWAIFLILLGFKLYNSRHHLKAFIKRKSLLNWKDLALAVLIIGFAIFFIVTNILPFKFVGIQASDAGYLYTPYVCSHNTGEPCQDHATTLGGTMPLFILLYKIADIDTFQKSIWLTQILLSIIFLISLFILQKITQSFIQEKNSGAISTLVVMLYFSMLPITQFFWIQKLYYLSAQILFFMSFYYLLDYFRGKSPLSFFLCLLSSLLSSLTRPEFAILALFIFAMHLLHYLVFWPIRLHQLRKKEKLFLLINLICLLIISIVATNFVLENYTRLYNSGTMRNFIPSNILASVLKNISRSEQAFLSTFPPFVNTFLILFSLGSLTFYSYRRKYVFLSLIFGAAFTLPIITTTFYDAALQAFYSLFLFYILFIHALSWLLSKKLKRQHTNSIISLCLVILILFSSIYIATSTRIIDSDRNIFYGRAGELDMAQGARDFYRLSKDTDTLFFGPHPLSYFLYTFAHTNSTFLDYDQLSELSTTYREDHRTKLIAFGQQEISCSNESIIPFFKDYFKIRDLPADSGNYLLIQDLLNRATIKEYARFQGWLFCEIVVN